MSTQKNKNSKSGSVQKTPQKQPSAVAAKNNALSKKTKIIIFALALALLLAITGVLLIAFVPGKKFVNDNGQQTRVGFYAEYLGEVPRNIPKISQSGGLESGYPKYGSTLGLTAEQKALIIAENNQLCAKPTQNASGTYDKMDAEGNLYLDGNDLGRKLYKHVAADGMYLGNVSDDEPAVAKRITMQPRGYRSYGVTGLYAPAGEVIKIEISRADMEATGGLIVYIGQALYNGQANNIWAAKNFNRMPVILNTMAVTTATATLQDDVYTAYVGSFLGGPIYIGNENKTFTVTISGAVNYSHYILGYTTRQEFEQNAKSTAPYFDLEVWEYGVLHSGPNYYAKAFNYEQLTDAAIMWEKISLVSTRVSSQGIVFLYDPFVAAGAAVAFPGRQSVNCPMGWMSASLNYNAFVQSGSWGNMHEYNHNFQSGWGMGNGGEVTNNALNLVEYSAFTKISSSRKLGASGDGMGGWNRYTSPSWSLQQTINKSENQLREYATVLHSFGAEAFVSSIEIQRATSGYATTPDGWYQAVSDATHNNLTYLFKEVMGYSISDAALQKYSEKNYPMFVPVSTVYQTGRSFVFDGDKRYITTAQPYVIPYGKTFTIDLRPYASEGGVYKSGSIVLPNGLTYKVTNVSQPKHGKITSAEDGVYTFTPSNNLLSGQIIVTLQISDPTGTYRFNPVDLVLEFEQSHELNKNVLERTTYTYAADGMYTNAVSAFENGYKGYLTKSEEDNNNYIESVGRVVQNANAEIWGLQGATSNTVMELKGKLYVADDGNYRIALRGRKNAALYLSFDEGKTYQLAASIENGGTTAETFGNKVPQHYKDYALKSDSWVYFKAILIVDYPNAYVGVGFGIITPEMGIMDESGNYQVLSPETCTVNYATAYRSTYQTHTEKFQTDYLYTRRYNYTYNVAIETQQSVVDVQGYTAAGDAFAIDNISNDTAFICSKEVITPENPFELTVDLGKEIYANSFTIYGYNKVAVASCGMPTNFELSVSRDGQKFVKASEQQNVKVTGYNMTFTMQPQAFRYYKLVVTSAQGANSHVAYNRIVFGYTLANGRVVSPDNAMFIYTKRWDVVQGIATFGHLYQGKNGATVQFAFEGTSFAILAEAGSEFNVHVDGKKVESVTVKADNGQTVVVFVSPLLQSGTHNVKITCKGSAKLDSFILW